MGTWSNTAVKVDESWALGFSSWDELHDWFDSCDPDGIGYRGNSCPLIEALFVIGCYQQFRGQELLESGRGIYSDTPIDGTDFRIVGEVPLDAAGFDLESLPMWRVECGGSSGVAYPEEIFVRY